MNTPHRITREEVVAAPWRYTPDQWRIVHGIERPHIAEISPMQLGLMNDRQRARYQRERSEKWAASAAGHTAWLDAITAAHDAGLWDWRTSRECSEDAKRAYIHVEITRDKEAVAARFKRLQVLNQAGDTCKVGDIVFNLVSYGRVAKILKHNIVCEGSGMKWSKRGVTWLFYGDLQKLAEGGHEEIVRKTTL